MGFNPFIGWTEVELVTELRSAQEELARGSQVVGTGSGDVNATFLAREAARTRIETLLMALHRLNPDDYPLYVITRVRKTVSIMGGQI